MTKNSVGGHQVKIELRQRPVPRILLSGHIENHAGGQIMRDRLTRSII